MTDTRLLNIVHKAIYDYTCDSPHSKFVLAVAESLERAGVSLPPEPEIPVSEAAIVAARIASGSYGRLTFEEWITSLRAAYPHIVAAVIDSLPDDPNVSTPHEFKVISPDRVRVEYVRVESLHKALKSSKA